MTKEPVIIHVDTAEEAFEVLRSKAHKALLDTPLPRRLLGCKRDKRGYPIPFLMVEDSQIHIDGRKQERCAMERLCMICGKRLNNKKWFIGGRHAAMNRLFSDPAMHEECARYALKVCPFLSNPDMKYRKKYEDGTTFFTGHIPGHATHRANRSETQVLMRTSGYRPVWWRDHAYVLANHWDYIEHWRNGEKVETPEGFGFDDLWLSRGVFDPGGLYHNELRNIR